MTEKVYDRREALHALGPMKASDVRNLRICETCGHLGNRNDMIGLTKHWHPKCYYEVNGEIGVITLQSKDRAKFRLCDIPHDLMRRLVG
jgi:hypothetical protein